LSAEFYIVPQSGSVASSDQVRKYRYFRADTNVII